MTIYRPVVWTAALNIAAGDLATQHRNADIAARAREIFNGAKVRATLTPMQCEFVAAMRSRFGWAEKPVSATAERAFENAWGDAWEKAQALAQPAETDLPRACYVARETDAGAGEIILVKRGAVGFWPTGYDGAAQTLPTLADAERIVRQMNDRLGVTLAQAAAMSAGSMFGFDTPGADPARYDAEGRFKRA